MWVPLSELTDQASTLIIENYLDYGLLLYDGENLFLLLCFRNDKDREVWCTRRIVSRLIHFVISHHLDI